MITQPMDVLKNHEIRKTKKQKSDFISSVNDYVAGHHYSCRIEKGSMGSRNIVIGDPEKAAYLVTGHYDTPASIGIPNLITPCNFLTFLIYQILVVGVFFLAAFIVGLITSFLTDDQMLIFWAAFIAYFGLLLLMMLGPANRHNANDNTSGVVTVLETLSTLPDNLRDRVCFVLFDLENACLVGSSSYRKAHKAATDRQIVLNLDCVGDGDRIVLFPVKKLKKDAEKMSRLRKIVSSCGKKSISVREKGFSYYPSDQKNFPYGVGIAALHHSKAVGLWLGRIHTYKDTVLEQTNVNILRAAIISCISGEK